MNFSVLAALLLQIAPVQGPPQGNTPPGGPAPASPLQGLPTPAQRPSGRSPEELKKQLDAKLASLFLKNHDAWFTDYEAALAEAKKRGTLIFGYFTRSDVDYASCTALENGLLLEPEFKKWLGDYVAFCHVTTGIRDRKGEDLYREKGSAGYPAITFFDENGNVLFRHQDVRTLEKIMASGKSAKEFLELTKKAAAGDSEAGAELLIRQLDSSLIRPQDAVNRSKDFKNLSEATKNKLAEIEFEVELENLFRASVGRDQEIAAAAEKVLAWYDQKRIPTRERAANFYFGILIQYGRIRKDTKIFELAIAEQEKRWANDPLAKSRAESLKSELVHLRKLASVEELKKKASEGDKPSIKQLFLLELELQQITYKEAQEKLKQVDHFTPEEKANVDGAMAELEFRDITTSVRDKATLADAGKRALKIVEEKRFPQKIEAFQRFWVFIINYGANTGDEDAINIAITNLKERIAKGSQGEKENEDSKLLSPILQMAERRLDEIKKRKASPASQPAK